MKVSIGYKNIEGPWGGGLNFSKQLIKYLEKKNISVVSDLSSNDIDIILLTEPRRFTQSSSFTHLDVLNYMNNNEDTIVINRINECDERKDTKGLNKFLINTSMVADHTVFISDWLKDLFSNQGFIKENNSVIHNGADKDFFYKNNEALQQKKFRIVTHHWGANSNKGIKTYAKLDNLLEDSKFNEKFEFIYIGNMPKNVELKNTKVIEPMNHTTLSKFLRTCDIYITGSENEPAGMHHIEGAMSGLPILYLKSGGITEYCKDYGLDYEINNLREKISEITLNYKYYREKLEDYKFTGENMCKNYFNLFENLLSKKEEILKNREKVKKLHLKNQYKIAHKYLYF